MPSSSIAENYTETIENKSPLNALVAIAGATACGKTAIGVQLANLLDGEILSADSRQVYKRMDIGTGKDLNEYTLSTGKHIPYHLIDIEEPSNTFDIYQWLKAFKTACLQIQQKQKTPIIVGGTGFYLEAALKGTTFDAIPCNNLLRSELEHLSKKDLLALLSRFKTRYPIDTNSKRRIIRGIEVATFYLQNPELIPTKAHIDNSIPYYLFILNTPKDLRIERINLRLNARLENGMVDEIQALLNEGIPAEKLLSFGLEYKYITRYLLGELSYETMKQELSIAIRQFAKRQMTWFRGMEKRGLKCHWIDATQSKTSILNQMCEVLLHEKPEKYTY